MTVSYDLIGSVTQPNMAFDVASAAFSDEGDHLYVLGAATTTAAPIINTFDVTDPTSPTLLHTLTLPGFGGGGTTGVNGIMKGVAIDGDYLYLSTGSFWPDGSGWLWVVDISTRSAPADVGPIARVASWQYQALHAPGDGYLYACLADAAGSFGAAAKLGIYSLSTPSSPSLVGSLSLASWADYAQGHGLRVAGDRALLVTDWFSFPSVKLIDVTTRTAPSLIANIGRVSPPLEQSALDPAGTVGYYHYNGGSPASARTLETVTAGTTLGTVDISALGVRAAFWDSDYVVLPGAGVIDVSDPTSPTVAVITSDSFNSDWAADYHLARRLTANADDNNTSRVDIGLVVLSGGWQVGSVAF